MLAKKNNKFSLWLQFILFFVALFIFGYIAHETVQENEDKFDLNIIAYHVAHPNAGWVQVMKVITFFGSAQFLWPANVILVAYCIFKKKNRHAIAIAAVAIGASLLCNGLKLVFHRDRPDLPLITKLTNYSFPSGHASSSFVFCSILAWFVWQSRLRNEWKLLISIMLLLFTVAIGASRVILNVHYATDVIGGFMLGIMYIILVRRLLYEWLKKEANN